MASTAEMTTAGILLFVNSFAIAAMYFASNVILGPILDLAASWNIHPTLQQSMWETSFIYSSIFAFLLIFEVIIIISFAYMIGRRQVSPFDY